MMMIVEMNESEVGNKVSCERGNLAVNLFIQRFQIGIDAVQQADARK